MSACTVDELLSSLLKGLLPKGPKTRRIPVGLASGISMGINFQGGQIRLFAGLYEVELAPYFRRLCTAGIRAFDVGGNVGYDALLIAKLTRGPVLSIECERELCHTIRTNAAENPALTGLIAVEQGFVGHGPGEVTLDELAERYFIPQFIKMDIEGAESRALEGANTLLSNHQPAMLIEVHGQDIEDLCIDQLRTHHYHITTVNQRRWLPEYRPINHNRWLIAYT